MFQISHLGLTCYCWFVLEQATPTFLCFTPARSLVAESSAKVPVRSAQGDPKRADDHHGYLHLDRPSRSAKSILPAAGLAHPSIKPVDRSASWEQELPKQK